jgi:hypothetical protein
MEMYFLRLALSFTRLAQQRNAEIRKRLKVTDVVQACSTNLPAELEK